MVRSLNPKLSYRTDRETDLVDIIVRQRGIEEGDIRNKRGCCFIGYRSVIK